MVKRKARKKTTTKVKKVKKTPTPAIEKPEVPKPVETPRARPRETITRRFTVNDFPEVGEMVVGTCTKITAHGAYLQIGGYEKLGSSAGFVHISELSRTWVRNIRKFIREGQRTVTRVMRINVDRQEVDLSIRRVNDSQRRRTLQTAKQEQRAKGILKAIGKRFELTLDQIDEQLIEPLEATGSIYTALELARDDGVDILLEAGLEKTIADEITQIATKELERPSVTLAGKVTVSTADPEGMNVIKNSFNNAMDNILKDKALKMTVLAISAPDYKVTLDATDWKEAEKHWQNFQISFEKSLKKEAKDIITLEFARE